MFNFSPWTRSIDTALESMHRKVLLTLLQKLVPNQNRLQLVSISDWHEEFALKIVPAKYKEIDLIDESSNYHNSFIEPLSSSRHHSCEKELDELELLCIEPLMSWKRRHKQRQYRRGMHEE